VTVVPGINLPALQEASPVTEYQKLLEGFSPGQYNTDDRVWQSNLTDYQNQLADCPTLSRQ